MASVAKPSVRIRSLLKIGNAATAIRTCLAGHIVETHGRASVIRINNKESNRANGTISQGCQNLIFGFKA